MTHATNDLKRPRFQVNRCVGCLTAFAIALGTTGLPVFTRAAIAQEQKHEQKHGQKHEQTPRTLTTNGRAIVSIPTSLTQVQLGVEIQAPTARDAQEETARRANAIVNLLEGKQVEKLQTTGIRLSPVYKYENNEQILTGYSASNVVSFRIETERAGATIDAAVRAGATRIDGLSFVATPEAIDAARKQALREATLDARAQAKEVLSALGLTEREINRIIINADSPAPILQLETAVARASDFAESPVRGGEQQIFASVTLEIIY